MNAFIVNTNVEFKPKLCILIFVGMTLHWYCPLKTTIHKMV